MDRAQMETPSPASVSRPRAALAAETKRSSRGTTHRGGKQRARPRELADRRRSLRPSELFAATAYQKLEYLRFSSSKMTSLRLNRSKLDKFSGRI